MSSFPPVLRAQRWLGLEFKIPSTCSSKETKKDTGFYISRELGKCDIWRCFCLSASLPVCLATSVSLLREALSESRPEERAIYVVSGTWQAVDWMSCICTERGFILSFKTYYFGPLKNGTPKMEIQLHINLLNEQADLRCFKSRFC